MSDLDDPEVQARLGSLLRYVNDQTVIDLVGEAWRVLSNPDDSGGKGNIGYDAVGWFDEEFSKMAKRAIRGYAEANRRPVHWPWTDSRFDMFAWGSGLVVDGEVVPERAALPAVAE